MADKKQSCVVTWYGPRTPLGDQRHRSGPAVDSPKDENGPHHVTTQFYFFIMWYWKYNIMMTSSNGNIFRVIGHLCGEFTGQRGNSPHKGQWRGAMMFSLKCARIKGRVNNGEAGDLRRHRVHHDVIVMFNQYLRRLTGPTEDIWNYFECGLTAGVPDTMLCSLQWRHNDHDGVSNHQPHGCLLNRLFRRRSKKTSKLRVTGLCVGKSPGPVNSPHKGTVTRKMFPFDDVIMFLRTAGNVNYGGDVANDLKETRVDHGQPLERKKYLGLVVDCITG